MTIFTVAFPALDATPHCANLPDEHANARSHVRDHVRNRARKAVIGGGSIADQSAFSRISDGTTDAKSVLGNDP
jgi:hypothetical protein